MKNNKSELRAGRAIGEKRSRSITEELPPTVLQFVRFGLVGVSNTAIGYLIYVLTLYILRREKLLPNTDMFFSQFMMFVISVAWSFYWNERLVFKNTERSLKRIVWALIKTYISYAFTSLFLSELLLLLWVNVLGINELLAPILSLMITVPLNFTIQKYWAFR